MSDQDTVPDNTIPPKVTPFAKPPPAATPAAPAAPAAPGSPRRTSRIPLTGIIPSTMATAPVGQSRTIRIRPVGPQPGSNPIPDGPRPPTEAQVQASKSKTSRISLDAAIGAESTVHPPPQAVADAQAPKTIRLKRPTEMPTVKVAMVPPPAAAAQTSIPGPARSTTPISPIAAALAASSSGQTSRISDPLATADNAPITQKRTIRVKRPAAIVIQGGAAEGYAEGGSTQAGTPLVGATAPDRAHPFFITAAIIIILAALGLAVIYSSQIFGPNASLTELSVWPTGPDFPLPGTVTTGN